MRLGNELFESDESLRLVVAGWRFLESNETGEFVRGGAGYQIREYGVNIKCCDAATLVVTEWEKMDGFSLWQVVVSEIGE